MSTPPPIDQIIADMLNLLRLQMPGPVSVPPSDVSVAEFRERAVGIGNRRGVQALGAFGIRELKGLRIEATVRFHFWRPTAAQVEQAVATLNQSLLVNKIGLLQTGFLLLNQVALSTIEFVNEAMAWRKSVDYRVLYEFHYADSDDALSLISRIPVFTDPEQLNSPFREENVVTDAMVRWDDESAPNLSLRGRQTVRRLSLLLFIAGAAPTGTVSLLRTYEGASGPPDDFSGQPFEDFMAAVVAGPAPNRHAVYAFNSLADFRDAFDPAGPAIGLGDWNTDGVLDSFEPRTLFFDSPIQLTESNDRLEIVPATAPLNQVAVAYLKATPA